MAQWYYPENCQEVADLLSKRRHERQVRLLALEEVTGITKAGISRLENNPTSIKLNTLESLCKGLHVPSRYMVTLSRGQPIAWCSLADLGPYARTLRLASLARTAKTLGISHVTIHRLEYGTDIAFSSLAELARAYQCAPLGLYA